jgi:lysophospholipase L1-like esterase
MKRFLTGLLILVLSVLCAAQSLAQTQLKDGDYVAVIGDSITEQRLYSMYIEDYLLMCKPAANLRATQFGWGGETAAGFARRMGNDCVPFAPTVVTTCFGMNDGGYGPMDRGKANWYRENQKSIIDQFRKAGVRVIVVGSPGVVDATTYHNKPEDAAIYNKTLAAERDIVRELAQKEGVIFANVFDPMMDVMTKAKAQYGDRYHVAGGDGVHPDRNGQLVMAYAFLKALGCDGNIGTITIDLGAGKAEAIDGHRVISYQNGSAEIESSRYPFCFYGDPKATNATTGIIEFFPFNDELNRFKLVVKGAGGKPVRVTWGNSAKTFPAADAEKGVNLAAEFIDNPFSEPFKEVERKIAEKQGMEVRLIKQAMRGLGVCAEMLPDEAPAIQKLAAALVAKDKAARDACAAAVKPVRHVIKVEVAD